MFQLEKEKELMSIDYVQYSKIFKVFSDPKRLKIVDMLSNGELCACKIQEEFNITQPTLSHDMISQKRFHNKVLYRKFHTNTVQKLGIKN